MPVEVSVFWFRRDLRLHDNAGLYHALRSGRPVLPVFIFDANILNSLEHKDKRVQFIYDALAGMQQQLVNIGSTMHILHGTPVECFKQLLQEYTITGVYANHDYEPYAVIRDKEVATLLNENAIGFYTCKDQVIFEKSEVVKDNGEPYSVFTPYSRKWMEKLDVHCVAQYPCANYIDNFYRQNSKNIPALSSLGFGKAACHAVPAELDETVAADYDRTRDMPSIAGTTRMSVHLRFGTASIRDIAGRAAALNKTLLNELIWRDFYQMILWHYPHVVAQSFKKEYDKIEWRNNEREFEKWCNGQTGYPIVDAGMRELNETGFMHNRVRMITASFLTKHLLVDWRWGEAYFGEKLLDYDLAANNGGWQWASGSGCDAAPYFRIFNPYLQTKKFDPELKYVRKWVTELDSGRYPPPIVEHTIARERCLAVYKKALRD